ncbi:NAD(P)H-binding protein [Thermomonospora amylolytica]|uniref:NAD(P)H-binding protein n=1 Tax=Thermomonospora amylolytica TaxID=1411117 RepID=UPI000E6C8D20|nr:NAD(P)H-binding protein [Thermomonospora amylolytica]
MADNEMTLVLGGTGKTGRRVAERLKERAVPVRIGSRSADPAFDWEDPGTWAAVLDGVTSVYVAYQPDLAVPQAPAAITAFTEAAREAGVRRLVLLSGRGEEEARRCEDIVWNSGLEWTIVRAAWFHQNFSESDMLGWILDGALVVPAGRAPEPYVDADDIADVAVAALTEDGHAGRVHEVTGPRPLTFADVAAEISAATGREIALVEVPVERYPQVLADAGVPAEAAGLLTYLFVTIMDGRNSHVTDGVRRALGREPRDFTDYARSAAASGVWDPPKD